MGAIMGIIDFIIITIVDETPSGGVRPRPEIPAGQLQGAVAAAEQALLAEPARLLSSA
jgi:hypothetical protein